MPHDASVTSATDRELLPDPARLVISTDGIAPSDRFEWWRSAFGTVHKVEVDMARRGNFAARGEHWRLGQILVGRYRTPARTVVRTRADIRRDDADHWILRVVRQGVLLSNVQGSQARAVPRQLLLSTFGEGYREEYSAGEWTAVMIPRDALPALAACAPGVKSGVKAGLLADFILSLDRRLPEALPADLTVVAELTRTMVAGCLLGGNAPRALTPAERLAVLREVVDRVIRQNIGSARLGPERICAHAGISRSALYRVFEEQGGVAAHVQNLRLEGVHADLCDPRMAGEAIASLAARWGLHNAASFSRAFRRRFGYTPREVRAAAISEPASAGVNLGQAFAAMLG